MNYHLIPYNFELYDFEKLLKEEKELNGAVLWRNVERHSFDNGDKCYFYCTNLPDMTKRILFRADVSDPKCNDEDGKQCFKIKNIESILLNEPQNNGLNYTYSYENLINIFNISTVRGKQKLNPMNHGDLIESLKTQTSSGNLKVVKEYYENMTKCIFEEFDHNSKLHKTFSKRNGFPYFETHHVILQNLIRNNQINPDTVDNLKNKVFLCPICHRKIHSGNIRDVQKMLSFLYDKEKEFFDNSFAECTATTNVSNALDWLYELYKVNE